MPIKILLIQPPIQDFYTTPKRLFPLGLVSLASVLSCKGHDVKIIDCHEALLKTHIPTPSKFKYISKYYDPRNKSPFKIFGRYYHFGLTKDILAERLKELNPDIVGISSNFSPYYESSIWCADIVKEINPKTITVFGGIHASIMPETIINNPSVDFIIKGEAEFAFAEFVNIFGSGKTDKLHEIPGLVYKNNGSLIIDNKFNIIEDLNSLPFLNLKLLPKRYFNDTCMIQTSRGCKLNCSFCAIPSLPSKQYRIKSPERVINEIAHLKKHYSINHIDIEDDNFTADIERSEKILDLIKSRVTIRLSAMNGLSDTYLYPKLLVKMKEAGFRKLNLSIVSSSYDSRCACDRKSDLGHLDMIIEFAHSINLEVETHFIIGIPEESPENTLNTLLHLAKLPTKIGGSIFYPVFGTDIFNKCKENNWIENPLDPSFWRLTLASTQSYPDARTDQITFLYLVRIVNFLKETNAINITELGRTLIKKLQESKIIYKAIRHKKDFIYEEEPLNRRIISLFLGQIGSLFP